MYAGRRFGLDYRFVGGGAGDQGSKWCEVVTEDDSVKIDPDELSGLVATPRWLRDLGLTSWLIVGVLLLLVGAVWILSLTHTIVMPVIAALVVASVAAPLVRWLGSHRIPRGLSAALLLVSMIVLAAGVVFVVVAGITSQTSDLSGQLSDAKNTIVGWLKDLGVDPSTGQRREERRELRGHHRRQHPA